MILCVASNGFIIFKEILYDRMLGFHIGMQYILQVLRQSF